MNTSEAKETLLLYRGRVDDSDPRLQVALAQARRDPELAEWLREQCACYEATRSKLREVEPPDNLADRIIRNRPIPFRRNGKQILELAAAVIISAGITVLSMKLWQRDRHRFIQGQQIVVKGEVLDMACYIAYHMSGPEHASCAKDCIRDGLPVGIKTEDGKVYLLTGYGAHVNAELADYAAKIVTVRGKATARAGFTQLQVEEIRKF
jgi:hypothetical protein